MLSTEFCPNVPVPGPIPNAGACTAAYFNAHFNHVFQNLGGRLPQAHELVNMYPTQQEQQQIFACWPAQQQPPPPGPPPPLAPQAAPHPAARIEEVPDEIPDADSCYARS
jgi:phenylpropionate dioxygenase-like ring-hydroxylating dioxygenase large terminal subunit